MSRATLASVHMMAAARSLITRHGSGVVATTLLVLVLGGIAACSRPEPLVLDADQVLRRMSAKLAGANRLGVTARREVDAELVQGRDLQPVTTINVRLVRPQRIVVTLDAGAERRAMYSDGKTFTLQDLAKNLYSTAPVEATLDNLDDVLQRLYGFAPPMFEFLTNNPYESIQARVTNVADGGQGLDDSGVLCRRITATGDVADAELWVDAKDFLPRQMIATIRTVPGYPKIRLFFTSWDLSPKWSDTELAFAAPAGAMKIPMRSVAEMQTLMKGDKR